jgi:hypothetical protein
MMIGSRATPPSSHIAASMTVGGRSSQNARLASPPMAADFTSFCLICLSFPVKFPLLTIYHVACTVITASAALPASH